MGPLTRKTPGWELRLHEAIESARGRSFQWGSHDCAIWAFDTAASLAGSVSGADHWRGKYKTALGAERAIRKLGWPRHYDMGAAIYGAPLPTVLLAQRGDLLLGPEDAFGICVGAQGAYLAPEGVVLIPLEKADFAWRI